MSTNYSWTMKTAIIMANAIGGNKDITLGPRGILKRQMERLKAEQITATIGASIDFYLYSEQYEKVINKNSPEPYFDTRKRGMMYVREKQQLYINDIISTATRSGIKVITVETGNSRGQITAKFLPSDALTISDCLTMFKKAMHQMAMDKDMTATFMALPNSNKTPSKLSLNISLEKDGSNIISDSDKYKVAKGFLTSMSLQCPNPNSYKRFVALKKNKVELIGDSADALISVNQLLINRLKIEVIKFGWILIHLDQTAVLI